MLISNEAYSRKYSTPFQLKNLFVSIPSVIQASVQQFYTRWTTSFFQQTLKVTDPGLPFVSPHHKYLRLLLSGDIHHSQDKYSNMQKSYFKKFIKSLMSNWSKDAVEGEEWGGG
jgi:hypothetical protein